jgi:hypothetical protein
VIIIKAHPLPFILSGALCLFSIVSSGQQWAIRPELLLTSTKAKMVDNSTSFKPYTSVYNNLPDISLSVDYYNKNKNRWSLGIGTFSPGLKFQGNGTNNNGILGFLFPPGIIGLGTGGGVQLLGSYEQLLFPKMRSQWFLGGGLNCWLMTPYEGVGSNIYLGDAIILSDSLFRANAITAGWHIRSTYVWKNKKQKEVMQFILRINGSFGMEQHTLITRYDLLSPEQISNQIAKYKLTGAGIQIGFSKTIVFLPRQKR